MFTGSTVFVAKAIKEMQEPRRPGEFEPRAQASTVSTSWMISARRSLQLFVATGSRKAGADLGMNVYSLVIIEIMNKLRMASGFKASSPILNTSVELGRR